MGRGKSWREKLEDTKDLPRVVPLTKGMKKRYGEGTIVIPSPKEVQAIMKKVPKGKLITINQIRDQVARQNDATVGCPIVTGIHARIVAGAAGDDEADGKKRITPYWRTLKAGGMLNEKYPGGVLGQRERLEAEGHVVQARGRNFVVQEFEKALVKL